MKKTELKPYRFHYPPSMFWIRGKYYTSTDSGWMELPDGTTLEDLRKVWIDSSIKPKKTGEDKVQEFQIKSGRGEKYYTVKNKNGEWSCTCTGFGFRRKCTHIETAKKQKSV